MINKELKEKIYPNLKLATDEEDEPYLESMFEECYKLTVLGEEAIVLKPTITMYGFSRAFSILTGTCICGYVWEVAKEYGELV